jgi:hypothetical protein
MNYFFKCLAGTGCVVLGLALIVYALHQWRAGVWFIAAPASFLSFCFVFGSTRLFNSVDQASGW